MDESNGNVFWTPRDGAAAPGHPPAAHPHPQYAEPRYPQPPAPQTPQAPPLRATRPNPLLRTVLPLAGALAVALGLAGLYLWSQSTYRVVERAGGVAVQHGLGPLATYLASDVDLGLLPTTARADLAEGMSVKGEDGATAALAALRAQAHACTKTLVAPCPPRELRPASLTLGSDDFPHGNVVHIAWDDLDTRGGVVTTLLVDGHAPAKPCPPVLTAPGSCTLKGRWDHAHAVHLITSGPSGTKDVTVEDAVITKPRPSIRVAKGDKVSLIDSDTGKRGRYCKVVVYLKGFAPETKYKITVVPSGHKPVKVPVTTDAQGELAGWVYGYSDADKDSWVSAEVAGVKAKRLPWRCAG